MPADETQNMPSAATELVIGTLLPRALSIRDDKSSQFVELVASLPDDRPADALAFLEGALTPAQFDMVAHLVAGAYYLDSAVTERLGYHGQEALRAEPDYDELAELAERVVRRGPVYIDTRTGAAATPEAQLSA